MKFFMRLAHAGGFWGLNDTVQQPYATDRSNERGYKERVLGA